MSITFEPEVDASGGDFLNVANSNGFAIMRVLGIDPDHVGSIDAHELIGKIAHVEHVVNHYLPRLAAVAFAAARQGKAVQWT